MYVVFEVKSRKGGARQIKVNKINQNLQIDYQKATNLGEKIVFDRVLVWEEKFGHPYLDKVRVIGEVIKHGKQKKITIFKYKAKKRYKKKQGHRQLYTRVRIKGVEELN